MLEKGPQQIRVTVRVAGFDVGFTDSLGHGNRGGGTSHSTSEAGPAVSSPARRILLSGRPCRLGPYLRAYLQRAEQLGQKGAVLQHEVKSHHGRRRGSQHQRLPTNFDRDKARPTSLKGRKLRADALHDDHSVFPCQLNEMWRVRP